MARERRRLAAIVSADIAGYSRIMGLDESGTLHALKAHRSELVEPKAEEHGGRIVKSTGDGLLLEFPRVVDAVRFAADVQRGMAERNAGIPAELRLVFRMGINVGDIIIDGDDIFGDGVNVAARLQALAAPGDVCVSRIVYDQVRDKLALRFDKEGEHTVKNIARPVEVYRLELDSQAPTSRRSFRFRSRSRNAARNWSPAAAVLLAVAAVAAWIAAPRLWRAEPASPPALSLAVLPFAATAGASADQALADTLTRELTAALGQWRLATIASLRSASAYPIKSDLRAVARDLNVRFLTEGTVDGAGNRFNVDIQLIDGANATQLWSERIAFDPAAQDRASIVAQLGLMLRAMSMQTSDPLIGAIEAGKLYEQALRLNPNLLPALVARTDSLEKQLYLSHLAPNDRERMVREMDELSQRAVSIDDTYSAAWYARAVALCQQGRLEAALEANARYGRLEPARAAPLSQRAWFLLFVGRSSEALDVIEQALSRTSANSFESAFALATRCGVLLRLGRYDDAIADCEKAVANQDLWLADSVLVAAYAQKGDLASAAAIKARLLAMRPWYSLADEKSRQVSDNPTYVQQTETHFYAGLRKAGIPET